MRVSILKECGYEESALGFSLSYNSTVERAKEILPRFAFGVPGENKFLESIYLWLDVTAPRFWWAEADTYRLSTKQSESTMHTLTKKPLTRDVFEDGLAEENYMDLLNRLISEYKIKPTDAFFSLIKGYLPEGFLQRRIWVMNYKCLQNIVNQRKTHRLPQWQYFCNEVLKQVEHPEFLVSDIYMTELE